MIIKTFVFVLFSVTAVQVYAKEDLGFSQNYIPQTCTKEDLLHAQGKSPCIVKLKSARALAEEMGKQFAAYYNQLRFHPSITGDLLTTLKQNHTEFTNRLLDLLKEYRIDIAQLQDTYSSAKRKMLCKMYLPSIEKKHRKLETLGKSIRDQVVAARNRNLKAQANVKGRKESKSIWETIERPLFSVIGICVFCQYVYKIGKGIYTWGKSAILWGRNSLALAAQRANLAELSSTTDELIGEAEMGVDARQLLNNLAEVVEPSAELAETADQAVVKEAQSVTESFTAKEAATRAHGTPQADALLKAARAAEFARVSSAAESIEATQASEIAEVVQVARIAEIVEGIGEAAVEGAVEGAVENAVEGAVEGAVGVASEVAAEEVLAGVGEAIALEGAVGTAVAAPIAIAAVGVVAVGAAVTGIAYVIDPEGTKRFYKNVWISIRHLFGYY